MSCLAPARFAHPLARLEGRPARKATPSASLHVSLRAQTDNPFPRAARIFTADGTPTSGEIAVTKRTLIGAGGSGGAPQPASPPQVAMDAQGDFVISWVGWTQMNGGQVAVIARRFGPTGAPLG